MSISKNPERWHLEVVQGREPGRRYLLSDGETLLGNALGATPGVDLADQESPTSPRRMAARQSSLLIRGGNAEIRDHESPGGTFVNRQRVFVGQSRKLQPGDRIQVGSVQLVVGRETMVTSTSATPSRPNLTDPTADERPTSSGEMRQPYRFEGGPICRCWDDFLTLAAQRWELVRDELSSGRIASYLQRIGRSDLLPPHDGRANGDDRLDAWLALLPTSRSSAPELEVHPQTLVVRTSIAGGSITRTIHVNNVGYRPLRALARVMPEGSSQLRIPPEFSARHFTTIEKTELPVEIALPEGGLSQSLGSIVIESNGGTARVEVKIEHPPQVPSVPQHDHRQSSGSELVSSGQDLLVKLRPMPLPRRLAIAAGSLFLLRSLIMLVGRIPIMATERGEPEPRLGTIVLVLSLVGLITGLIHGARSGDQKNTVAIGFTGAMVGMFMAAIGFAFVRAFESILGSWASTRPVVLLFWAVIGVLAAILSWIMAPAPGAEKSPSPAPSTGRGAEVIS